MTPLMNTNKGPQPEALNPQQQKLCDDLDKCIDILEGSPLPQPEPRLWTRHGSGVHEWWSLGHWTARKERGEWVLRYRERIEYRHEYLQEVQRFAAALPQPEGMGREALARWLRDVRVAADDIDCPDWPELLPRQRERWLRVADAATGASNPLTVEFIEQHIGSDEGDREAVLTLVREVEEAHGIE